MSVEDGGKAGNNFYLFDRRWLGKQVLERGIDSKH